jgi:hypothetical protein
MTIIQWFIVWMGLLIGFCVCIDKYCKRENSRQEAEELANRRQGTYLEAATRLLAASPEEQRRVAEQDANLEAGRLRAAPSEQGRQRGAAERAAELEAGRLRDARIAEERRRRAADQQRKQAAQAEQLLRRRILEQQKRDRKEAAIHALELSVDLFIRTRKRFDSRSPLEYACGISSVLQDGDVQENLVSVDLEFGREVSLIEILCDLPRFLFFNNYELIGLAYLTPYQGNQRMFGHFKCGHCYRPWKSAFSWEDTWQKCQSCDSESYPYQQDNLLRSENPNDPLKEHDSTRCGKCIRLHRRCF